MSFNILFKLSLSLLLAISYVKYCADAQDSFCQNFPFNQGQDGFPLIPNTFQVRVEKNLINEKRTDEERLFYDFDRKRAAVEIREKGSIIRKLIFNYETDEIYSLTSTPQLVTNHLYPSDYQPLYPTTCETFPLSSTSSLNHYFGFQNTAPNLMPGPAVKVFKFYPQAFDGVVTIRNVQCDSYKSCQFDPDSNTNFTATHYFSKSNFIFPGSIQSNGRILIRIEYSGVRKTSNGDLEPYNHVHDYYDFRQLTYSDLEFETPGGVFCSKRKPSSIQPPNLPESFRFSEEVVEKGYVTYITNLIYDEQLQLTRYSSRKMENETDVSFNTDPHTYINDYNIGVTYSINSNTGKCRVRSISPFSIDSDRDFTQQQLNAGNGYSLRLKSPKSILKLDLDYVFTGKRNLNHIPTNVFVASASNAQIPITNEFAFSDLTLNITNNEKTEYNVPVRLSVNSAQANFSSYSSFFMFDTASTDLRSFDLSVCFPEGEIIRFLLKLKPLNGTDLDLLRSVNVEKQFVKPVLQFLGEASGEIALRFGIPQTFIGEDGTLYVRSLILPSPPPLAMFSYVGQNLLISTTFDYDYDVATLEECALWCFKKYNQCMSFDYSAAYRICYANTKHYQNATLSASSIYVHYSRNTLYAPPLNDDFVIYETLLRKTFNDSSKFFVNVTTSNGKTTLVEMHPQSIQKTEFDRSRFGATSALTKYNLKLPNKKFAYKKDLALTNYHIDDCARYCTDEVGLLKCNSFQYCFLSGDCIISKDLLSSEPTEYQSENYCDIYEKDSLSHYNLFPTSASINPKDKYFESVSTASDCASKCDNEVSIHCRSFNYCPNEMKCYLSETHLTDANAGTTVNADTASLTCNHYSRKYMQDFTYTNTELLELSAEIILESVDVEMCSFACVDADGFQCKSFDYCPLTKKCLLNSDTKAKSPIKGNQTDSCAHYRREYFFSTSNYRNTAAVSDSSEKTLTALSIVFTIIGVIAGICGTLVILKKKGHV